MKEKHAKDSRLSAQQLDSALFLLAKEGRIDAVKVMLKSGGNACDAAEGFAMSGNITELLNCCLKVTDIPPLEPNGYLVRECIYLADKHSSGLSHFDHVISLALPFMPAYASSIIKGIARSGNWQLLVNMSAQNDEFLRKYRDTIVSGFEQEGLTDAVTQFSAANDIKKSSRSHRYELKGSVHKKGIFHYNKTNDSARGSNNESPELTLS